MKQFFFFLIPFLLGILLVFAYRTYVPSHKKPVVKVPVASSHEFLLENAPPESIRGKITAQTGTIKWFSRTATEAAALPASQVLQQGEDIMTEKDGNLSVTFPTAGSVALQPETKVSIIQTLPESVVFEQEKGTATYRKIGNMPYAVRSFHVLMELTDGTMDVSADPDEKSVTIKAVTGDVRLAFNDSDTISTVVTVPAGSSYSYDDESRTGTLE